jgi:hypothetical protein
MRDVSLTAPDLPWTDFGIPASAPPVRLVRLHADAVTGASLLLVRFPEGWQRPAAGHYACGEEFVVLDGELWVSGVRYSSGHCGWLPAGAPRHDSAAPAGALAVAWFAGPPRWTGDPADRSTEPSLHTALDTTAIPEGGLLLRGTGPDGGTWLHETTPPSLERPAQLLWPAIRRYAFRETGEPLPTHPGRLLVRYV